MTKWGDQTASADALDRAVEYLRRASTVRIRCGQILRLARDQKLSHFTVGEDGLGLAAEMVVKVTKDTYPDLDVPYHSRWRHFDVGGIDRVACLRGLSDPTEQGRCLVELAITSVLLDAGAGPQWSYEDPDSGQRYGRSEGLAIASWHMYQQGLFSADPESAPFCVDAEALGRVTAGGLAQAFQHSTSNPLLGLEGRVTLLNSLGLTLQSKPKYFGAQARLGNFYDYLASMSAGGEISAPEILQAVLSGLSDIWPSRMRLGSANLGDVWRHTALQSDDLTSELVPFHKLSQWLTYSLIEPLEQSGLTVTDIDGLTGLPEYRNGGLLIDTGVLIPRYPDVLTKAFAPGDEVIVEWRALTVALLDELAAKVRTLLNQSPQEFPLAKVLQGGTWAAGRQVAAQKRSAGDSPIKIISDGTVF